MTSRGRLYPAANSADGFVRVAAEADRAPEGGTQRARDGRAGPWRRRRRGDLACRRRIEEQDVATSSTLNPMRAQPRRFLVGRQTRWRQDQDTRGPWPRGARIFMRACSRGSGLAGGPVSARGVILSSIRRRRRRSVHRRAGTLGRESHCRSRWSPWPAPAARRGAMHQIGRNRTSSHERQAGRGGPAQPAGRDSRSGEEARLEARAGTALGGKPVIRDRRMRRDRVRPARRAQGTGHWKRSWRHPGDFRSDDIRRLGATKNVLASQDRPTGSFRGFGLLAPRWRWD